MVRRIPIQFALAALAGLIVSVVALEAPTGTATTGQVVDDHHEHQIATQLGKLQYTRMNLEIRNAPAREVFDALGRALGVAVIGRYLDDRVGHGIDPEIPLTLWAENIDGLAALELLLAQCEEFEPVTWQMRNGFIEIGTKERLSAPTARVTRVYFMRDLMLEAPYFTRDGKVADPTRIMEESPYASALISRPAPLQRRGRTIDGSNEYVARKRPAELLLELSEAIVETIEPGNWDYGQFDDTGGADDVPDEQYERRDVSPDRPSNARTSRRYRPAASHKIARLRAMSDRLIISAPDFIHRQVNGYPAPIRPEPLSVEQYLERSNLASRDGVTITVLGIMDPPGEEAGE